MQMRGVSTLECLWKQMHLNNFDLRHLLVFTHDKPKCFLHEKPFASSPVPCSDGALIPGFARTS